MRFTVTRQEILTAPSFDDVILHILKDKGAPIIGNFKLRVDEKFTVIKLEKPNGDIIFIFQDKSLFE